MSILIILRLDTLPRMRRSLKQRPPETSRRRRFFELVSITGLAGIKIDCWKRLWWQCPLTLLSETPAMYHWGYGNHYRIYNEVICSQYWSLVSASWCGHVMEILMTWEAKLGEVIENINHNRVLGIIARNLHNLCCIYEGYKGYITMISDSNRKLGRSST